LTTHASVWNGVVVVPSAKAFEQNKDAMEQAKEEIEENEQLRNNEAMQTNTDIMNQIE
jgi:regulator of RNase E activity RraA